MQDPELLNEEWRIKNLQEETQVQILQLLEMEDLLSLTGQDNGSKSMRRHSPQAYSCSLDSAHTSLPRGISIGQGDGM